MDRNLAPGCRAPRCAREIAEAVDRDHHRLFERADVKGGGQMREVMLDPVRRRAEALARKCRCQQFRNSLRGYGDCATARRPAPDPVDGSADSQAYGRG